jgi:hypothetical protein
MPSPLLGRGKSEFIRIGNLKGPIVLGFDEVTVVSEASCVNNVIRAGKCDGEVEGGVSSSSDDEGGSAQEEVSEMRRGWAKSVNWQQGAMMSLLSAR